MSACAIFHKRLGGWVATWRQSHLFADIHGVVSFLGWKFGMKTSRQVQAGREADGERQRDTHC